MRQGEKEASNTPPTWWDNTKSFVDDKIIQPANAYVYEPYIVPAIDKRNEVLESVVSWANEKLYEPALEKTKQYTAWIDETIYEPFLQPVVSTIDEKIYQPVFAPVVNDINQYVYQPIVNKAENIWEKYGEWVHGALDTVGFIPGLGEIADG